MPSEAKMVYLVTSGEYSDYSILAAFSTREAAEAFVAQREARASGSFRGDAFELSYGERCDVEEYELDAEPEPQMNGAFRAQMETRRGYGDPFECYVSWVSTGNPSAPASAQLVPFHRDSYYVVGWGETREHAARSARELHRAILAGTVIPQSPGAPSDGR